MKRVEMRERVWKWRKGMGCRVCRAREIGMYVWLGNRKVRVESFTYKHIRTVNERRCRGSRVNSDKERENPLQSELKVRSVSEDRECR